MKPVGAGPALKLVNIAPNYSVVTTQKRSLLREEEPVVVRIIVIFLLLCSPALAHDPEHPELNAWFDSLRSAKGLCCSFADGFAVNDVDWESKGGHYRVRLEGGWIDVPDGAVITEPNRAGRTMVWPYTADRGTDHQHTEIRCFMPGSMG